MKNKQKIKQIKRKRRVARTRAKIFGTNFKPRLAVYCSLKYCYAQLIDDDQGKTLVSASDLGVKGRTKKTDRARKVGRVLAEKALERKIKEAVFDRRGYKYHGRVRALAEGAREGGLRF